MAIVQGVCAPHVVVLGAGVLGLTTALLLARSGYSVEVVARDLPTDVPSQDWSSPWAGGNWCPFSSDTRLARWETEGLARLRELIPTGLAMKLPIKHFAATEAGLYNHWYRDIVENVSPIYSLSSDRYGSESSSPDQVLIRDRGLRLLQYRLLPNEECPAGSVGVSFDSVSINAPVYLQWLYGHCQALGVSFKRDQVSSLATLALSAPDAGIMVNASGIGALTLEDVRDELVEPIRGQVVLVRAPAVQRCVMDASQSASQPTRSTYVIPRPNSGGEVICGGCYEIGSWNREADPNMTRKILQECLVHIPELATISGRRGIEGIEVIRECVGLRPSRRQGPRLERETIILEGRTVDIVHAYGIGPAGYQASWGMAKEACQLIANCVAEKHTRTGTARL